MSGSIVACTDCGAKNRLPVTVKRARCAKCQTDLPLVVEANDDDLQAALNTKQLVVIDLWAPWCGPCRMIAPILETLAADYAGRLKVVKVNVDNNPVAAGTYKAQSIPLLVFVRDGATVATVLGAQPESVLRSKVQANIGPA